MTHYTGIFFAAMAVALLVLTAVDRTLACNAMLPVSLMYAIGVAAIHKNKVNHRAR